MIPHENPNTIKPTHPNEKATNDSFAKPIAKKQRNETSPSEENITPKGTQRLINSLIPVKVEIDKSPSEHSLIYDQLQTFLEQSFGKADIIGIAEKLTDDFQNITSMLDLTYTHTKDQSLKARCLRIKRKLRSNSDSGSSHSQDAEEF